MASNATQKRRTNGKHAIAALVGLLALVLATLSFASSANAAPYSNPPTVGASTTNPGEGATITLTGSGYDPNETVDLTLHSAPYDLGSVKADATGAFSASVTLPAGVTGSHEIIATGARSGVSSTLAVCIGGNCSTSGGGGTTGGSGSSSGSGGLASTGVAVIGIGALGLVLLIGGGLMLLAGRRRNAAV